MSDSRSHSITPLSDETTLNNNREQQSTDEVVSTDQVNCSNIRETSDEVVLVTTGGGGGGDEGEQFVCSSSGCSTSSLDQVESATTSTVKGQDRKTDGANHDSTGATTNAEVTMIPTPPLAASPKANAGVTRSVSLPPTSARPSTNSSSAILDSSEIEFHQRLENEGSGNEEQSHSGGDQTETESPHHHSHSSTPTPPRFRENYTPLDPEEETRRYNEKLQGIQRRHEEQREKEVQQAEQRLKRMTSLPSLPSKRWDQPVGYDAATGAHLNKERMCGIPQPKPNYTETPTTYRGDPVVAEVEARIAERKTEERRYQLELRAKMKELEEERARRRQEEEEQAKNRRAEERRLKQEELNQRALTESPTAYRNDPVIEELEKKLAERKAADRKRQEELNGTKSEQQKMLGTHSAFSATVGGLNSTFGGLNTTSSSLYDALTNTYHNPRRETGPRPKCSATPTSYREDPKIAEMEARLAEHKAAERLRTRELAAKAKEREEEIARLLKQEQEEVAGRRAESRRAKQGEIDGTHQQHLENESWRLERIRQLSLQADFDVLTEKKTVMASFDERRADTAREEEVARMKALEERGKIHRETSGSAFFQELQERNEVIPESLQKVRTWTDLRQEERERQKREEIHEKAERKERERLQREEYRAKCRELNRQSLEERKQPSATVQTNRRELEEARVVLETRHADELHFDLVSNQPAKQQYSPAPPRSVSPSTTPHRPPRCVTPSTTEELEAYEVVPSAEEVARKEMERLKLIKAEEDRRARLQKEEARQVMEVHTVMKAEGDRLARLEAEEVEEQERRTVWESESPDFLKLMKEEGEAMKAVKSKEAAARKKAQEAAKKAKEKEKKKEKEKASSAKAQKPTQPKNEKAPATKAQKAQNAAKKATEEKKKEKPSSAKSHTPTQLENEETPTITPVPPTPKDETFLTVPQDDPTPHAPAPTTSPAPENNTERSPRMNHAKAVYLQSGAKTAKAEATPLDTPLAKPRPAKQQQKGSSTSPATTPRK